MKTSFLSLAAFAAFAGLFASPASASNLVITDMVNGTVGPWLYSSSLNSSFQYGTDAQLAPVVISAANGFAFTAANTLTITYLSGTMSVGNTFPFTDANGDTAYPVDAGTGTSGDVFPSFFMNPSTYPINLGELVGAFANSSGVIVGTPFAIGDLASVVIPAGATQLQLGINDDIFPDNVGSYTVQVSGPAGTSTVPEPSTVTLLGGGLALFGLCGPMTRRAHRKTR